MNRSRAGPGAGAAQGAPGEGADPGAHRREGDLAGIDRSVERPLDQRGRGAEGRRVEQDRPHPAGGDRLGEHPGAGAGQHAERHCDGTHETALDVGRQLEVAERVVVAVDQSRRSDVRADQHAGLHGERGEHARGQGRDRGHRGRLDAQRLGERGQEQRDLARDRAAGEGVGGAQGERRQQDTDRDGRGRGGHQLQVPRVRGVDGLGRPVERLRRFAQPRGALTQPRREPVPLPVERLPRGAPPSGASVAAAALLRSPSASTAAAVRRHASAAVRT